MKIRSFWSIFDAEGMIVNQFEVFDTMFQAIDYIKAHYTYKEWLDAELTLNRFEADVEDNMAIIEFTDQINPFE